MVGKVEQSPRAARQIFKAAALVTATGALVGKPSAETLRGLVRSIKRDA